MITRRVLLAALVTVPCFACRDQAVQPSATPTGFSLVGTTVLEVRNAANDGPISGAAVLLELVGPGNSTFRFITDDKGRVSVPAANTSSASLRVRAVGFKPYVSSLADALDVIRLQAPVGEVQDAVHIDAPRRGMP